MANTTTKKAVVESIKKTLMNFDLALTTAYEEQQVILARLERYKDQENKWVKRKYVYSKCELEKNNIYIEKIQNSKKELLTNIDIVFEKYQPRYKKIFNLYYLENKNIEEISTLIGISNDVVEKILEELDNDLIDLYY